MRRPVCDFYRVLVSFFIIGVFVCVCVCVCVLELCVKITAFVRATHTLRRERARACQG